MVRLILMFLFVLFQQVFKNTAFAEDHSQNFALGSGKVHSPLQHADNLLIQDMLERPPNYGLFLSNGHCSYKCVVELSMFCLV